MVKSTKFKLGTQVDDDDLRHAQAPCPPRSNPKVTRSRDQSDACQSITRERKAVETPKLVGRFPTTSAILRISFKVKRSKIRVTDGVVLTHKMPHIFRMVKRTKFKLAHRSTTMTYVTHRRRVLQGQTARSQGHVTSLTRVSP